MKYEKLRKLVCQANVELWERKLVIGSWGNVSGINRKAGTIAIKPSGVTYEKLTPEKIVILDLDGNIKDGRLKPSSDTPTHLELYRNFKTIGGISHSHSTFATIWAQSRRQIPCFGTTGADYFHGPVPVTESMTEKQIQNNYELNTGKIIVKRFMGLDPSHMPAVLVANHGPFTWGKGPIDAVEVAAVLEHVAAMALGTIIINPGQRQISRALLDKHYLRKHGKDAYYGQK